MKTSIQFTPVPGTKAHSVSVNSIGYGILYFQERSRFRPSFQPMFNSVEDLAALWGVSADDAVFYLQCEYQRFAGLNHLAPQQPEAS